MIDPTSIHHIEGVGEKAFPSLHGKGKKTIPPHHTSHDETETEGGDHKHHKHHHKTDQRDRQNTVSHDFLDDPNWAKLLEQEGYEKNPKGLFAEDKFDEDVLDLAKVISLESSVSLARIPMFSGLVFAAVLAAGHLAQLLV